MTSIKFSVIIPAYNNAEFLGEAIQSVLDQTYLNFEIMVVNDASPDNSEDVVKSFADPRVKYILHPENRGLAAARNTGIRNSTGDWIALLDGDDLFHPQKLEMHEKFIERHPDIGVTYNSRFELDHSAKTIRELWRPPLYVSLIDMVKGFPFGPSDMVVRRDWLDRVGLFNEKYVYVGEDLDLNCRLALAGCTFANVDRALNYRRYHSGRKLKDIRFFVDNTIEPLNATFSNPACPQEVCQLRDIIIAEQFMLFSVIAFIQNETELGHEMIRKAILLNPLIIGEPNIFLETAIQQSIIDRSVDHEQLLKSIFSQLPPELSWLSKSQVWAAANGYFIKGIRSLLWDHPDAGCECLKTSATRGFKFDEPAIGWLASHLTNIAHDSGIDKALIALGHLQSCFQQVGWTNQFRLVKANFLMNQAFVNYEVKDYSKIPGMIIAGWANDPAYMINKGVISIFCQSVIRMPFHMKNDFVKS